MGVTLRQWVEKFPNQSRVNGTGGGKSRAPSRGSGASHDAEERGIPGCFGGAAKAMTGSPGPGPRGRRGKRGNPKPPGASSGPLRVFLNPTVEPGNLRSCTLRRVPLHLRRRRWRSKTQEVEQFNATSPLPSSDPQDLVRRGPCGGTPSLRRGMAWTEKTYRTRTSRPLCRGWWHT